MITNKAYAAGLTLTELDEQIGETEGGLGALIGLGNQDGKTVGVHDDSRDSKGIVLRPGPPVPEFHEGDPLPVPVSGVVFILGTHQTVTAYHTR